jgi:DNA-binding transcriptional ArsR family regulator
MAEKLGVSQPTVSEHLKILAETGLVRGRRIKQLTYDCATMGNIHRPMPIPVN